MPRILITGFGPFHTHASNPSEELVKAIALKSNEQIEIVGEILPVVFSQIEKSFAKIHDKYDFKSFDAIIFCGLAASRVKVTPEKVALNWLYSKERKDNEGICFSVGKKIDNSVENALFSTFPVEELADFFNREGVSSEVSFSAGTYVCNSTFFHGLKKLKELGVPNTPCTFLHIPKDCSIEKLSSLIIEFLLFNEEFKIKV